LLDEQERSYEKHEMIFWPQYLVEPQDVEG